MAGMNTQPAPDTTLTDEDVLTCMRVLRAIEADRAQLTRLSQEQRRELLMLAGLVTKPERHDVSRMLKGFRRAKRQVTQEHDRGLIERAGLRLQRRSKVYAPLWLERPKADAAETRTAFVQERNCYVCKKSFSVMHRYYDSLCEACGEFNYAKREQTADLSGHYALVTGARVKIGFQASLMLLRAGAHVVVTTRFPVDAIERYSGEPDFNAFRERLQIHGLDLRHTPSVELFTQFLVERLPRLDYILNNACQTVRRTAGFFQHLLEREAESVAALPEAWRAPLASHDELRRTLEGSHTHASGTVIAAAARRHGEGLLHSAVLSQRRYLDEDYRDGETLFPTDRYDQDRQQVDL